MNKEAIIAKAAGAFNKVSPLLDSARLFLLKRGGETSRFTVVAEVEKSFWSRWSEYRQASVFMWASNDDWLDRVSAVSHIGFGVPDTDERIDIYEVIPESRDWIAPNAANLVWKLYGQKVRHERFTIPVPDDDGGEDDEP